MRNRTITAVEITDTHLKVLQADSAKGLGGVTYFHVQEILNKNDDAIAVNLKELVAASKLKVSHLVSVVPRRLAMLRPANLPTHNEDEIQKMIRLQVLRQVPYPPEDIVFDYILLDKEHSGYAKILVVIVHKEVTDRYLKIFQKAGLGLDKLTLSSTGLLNWYVHLMKKERIKEALPVVVIQLDTSTSEILFCQNDLFLFSRNVDFGSRDLTEEQMPAFVEQIHLTLTTYTKENIGGKIARILILSSLKEAIFLQEKLKKELPVPVLLRNPSEFMDTRKGKVSAPLLAGQGVSLAIVQGLTLPSGKRTMNLMSTEAANTRDTMQLKKEWMKFFLLLAVALVFGVLAFMVKIHKSSSYLKEIQQALKNQAVQVQGVNEMMRRLEFIEQKLGGRVSPLEIISELSRLTPEDVSFQSIHMDETGLLELQGISREGARVNDFQNSLVQSPLLKNVTLQYATKRRIFKGEVTDFKITCQAVRPAGNSPSKAVKTKQ